MALPLIFQETEFDILNVDTVVRDPDNGEASADNSGDFDEFDLRVGYSGSGYLDLGGGAEDKFAVSVPASELDGAGTYALVVKFANGSSEPRPLVIRNGDTVVAEIPDTNTGSFSVWDTLSLDIALGEPDGDGNYVLTFEQTGTQGPNVDAVAIAPAGQTVSFLDPVFEGADSFALEEGGTDVAILAATDADGQALSYEITGGADQGAFAIDSATGALSFAEAPVYSETPGENVYEVEVTATDEAGATVVRTVSVAVTEYVAPIYIQGETAVLTTADGGVPVSQVLTQTNALDEGDSAVDDFGLRPNYSGEGYLDFGSTGESATYEVDIPSGGTFDLHIRYASSGPRNAQVRIDGTTEATLSFPDTAGPAVDADAGYDGTEPFNNWSVLTTQITLSEGLHDLELFLNAGNGPNVDVMAITAVGGTPDFAPRFTSTPDFVLDEGETAAGTVTAADVDADTTDGVDTSGPVSFAVTGGADMDAVAIDSGTGALTLVAPADYEAKAQYEAEITVTDAGGNTVSQIVTIAVTDSDEAPSVPVFDGSPTFPADIAPGTVLGTLVSVDPEGQTVTFAIDDSRLVLEEGRIVVGEDATFASGETVDVTVTASDGGQTSTTGLSFGVTEATDGAPFTLSFTEDGLSSYAGSQDQGADTVISDDGATLELNDNHWKRAALGAEYTITAETRLSVEIAVGETEPELVAVGFDLDDNAFDGDASLYLLDGTDGQGAFVDLKGTGEDLGGGVQRYVIDLGAHAGTVIDSLVFIADDDLAANGIGSVGFSNVQLIEGTPAAEGNLAPEVVGGGMADFAAGEGSTVEIDLPFVDPEGAALSYEVTVTDGTGADVTDQFAGLSVADGTLTGPLSAAPGVYTITVTADDGAESDATATDSFQLTVENVNDAPVAEDVALEPYFGAAGQVFDGIDVGALAAYFSDADGDALTLGVDPETLPEGLVYDAEEQVILGTPSEGGSFPVTVTATDPGGLTATLTLALEIDAPEVGDSFTIEAETFTGLADSEAFYAAAAPGASGNQIIKTNANQSGTVSTDLAAGEVPPGYYTLALSVFDETDGSATFSIAVDGVTVVEGASFDDPGTWENGDGTTGRGNAAQAGNLKTLSFDSVIEIAADSVLTLTGEADGEMLRIDRLVLTRAEAPDLAPGAPVLDTASVDENAAAAVVGTLSAVDPEGAAMTFSTEDARFVVEGDSLRLADGVSFDHEAGETVQVEVTAADPAGNTTTAVLDIAVADLPEAPELAEDAAVEDVFVATGETGSVDLAAALGASDPDAGDTVAYAAQLSDGSPLPAGLTLSDATLEVGASLAEGSYEVEVFATDGALDSESVLFTVTVGEAEPFAPILIQAEEGIVTLSSAPDGDDTVTVIRDPSNPEETAGLENGLRPGFTGEGYVDYGDDPGDTLSYSFDVPAAGEYRLNIRYASQDSGGAARTLDLAVNGAGAVTTSFPSTGPGGDGPDAGFNNWDVLSVDVTLEAGTNTVELSIPAGASSGPNLDSLELVSAADTSADADEQPLFLSGPDSELNETQAASINFNLAGIDADIVTTEISFDGGATRTEVLPDADGDFTIDGSALAPGDYTVIAIVTDAAGNEAQVTMPIVVAGEDVTVDPFTIQAEDAGSVTVEDSGDPANGDFTRVVDADNVDAFGNYRAGATGGAYIDFGSDPGDGIVFNVDAPAAGTYAVTFRYANGGDENRPLDLSLNGGSATTVDFVPGPVVDVGDEMTGWESWVTQTVELDLAAGANQIRLEIPAGGTNGPNIDEATFAYQDGDAVEAFSVTVEGETFSITDSEAEPDTVYRTAQNPEGNATDANSGPGLPFDADGLRPGYEGDGYLDMGNDVGDSAAFTVDAPEAGTYQLTVRYVNGSTDDRPMALSVDGAEQTVAFAPTLVTGGDSDDHWQNWTEVTVDVELSAGVNEISFTNTVANGPNIDRVTVSREGVDPGGETRELITFEEVARINFQPPEDQTAQGLPAGYETPEGYLADTGAAYGDRGNGLSYGWVSEDSVADGTADGTTPQDQPDNAHWYKDVVDGASDLQKTYAHFEYPGAGADASRAWEMGLANGTYQLTVSVGDTAGAFDSNYVLNVEGQSFMPDWVPANPIDGSTGGGGFRSTLVSGVVTVEDGRLTIDSIGGENTEIQHLEIERIEDLTPEDDRSADQDYSFFDAPVAASIDGQTSIALGPDGELPTGIDPTSSFVVGVNLQAPGQRGPNVAYVDGVTLVNTLTGEEVAIDVQVSGGADSLTIRPLEDLDENTSYTLKVQDVMDLGAVSDAEAPLRQIQDLTTSFVTGEAPEDVPREVAFSTDVMLDGFTDGAGGYTVVEFGPDGKLYVGTITGEIHRWDVLEDGSIDKGSQETLSLDYLSEGAAGRRGIVGFTFDPNDPETIWISDNWPIPRESKAFDTPEFSGRVSKINLGEGGSFEGVTAETYATGFPRSGGDHVTNSLEFRANPDFGQEGEPEYLLYLVQGSNSAGGAPDNAWGNRPERLLNAAVLEIDPTRDAPESGFDVRTEPITLGDDPETSFDESAFDENGTYPGMYDPFAEDAVVKIFATGVRNAYDLVWHSNGNLYVPTNGTAAGAKTPQDPTQTEFDTTIDNSPKQYDYFFTVDEDGYYGHPNVLRDEYVLNGGNPTSGLDPNEVVGGNDGNPNTDGYPTGVQVDGNYDYDGVYNLGYNRSPNGATEYTGNAFGSNLKGAVLFAQFSTGDNVRVIQVDETGAITGDDVLRRPDGSVIDNYIDPLDIVENPLTGQLYLMTLNRGTGASQLILLTPAPGGVTQDLSADQGGDLTLLAVDVSDTEAALFEVSGLDDDITALRVSFDGGPGTTVTLDADNRFVIDLGTLEGETVATLEVTDDDLNTASASVTFTPGAQPEFVSLVTIQAEDRTPSDGTAVAVPTSPDAEIEIRDAQNPEDTEGLENGLRPGAFGTDGNTDNTDGTLGGYADYGSTNADFLTFTFDVPAENAGSALLQFRYANGGDGDRPLQVEVNGSIVTVASFLPTPGTPAEEEAWSTWQVVEVPATLVDGTNTVTLRSVSDTGPNIDQLEVLVSTATEGTPGDGTEVINGVAYDVYEAETATLDGPVVVTEERTQSGDFVDFDGTTDQSITWTVTAGAAGTYSFDILYALASTKAARPMALSVNGTEAGELAFAPNSNEGETLWGPQSATVDLVAGTNTITVTAPGANGPNVDYLRLTQEPVSLFEPVHADISGSGRIELEDTDGSANTINGSTVDFYFTVDSDGVYQIDTAANAGASDGLGLTWFLNGTELDDSAFPGTGENGEESVFLDLQAGTEYQLRIISDAPGASDLDYLDISPSQGNANADIEVQSLDPAFLENRLHYSYLENAEMGDGDADRDFKDSGTVRIGNSGTEALEVLDVDLTGPFVLADPDALEGLTLAPGEVLDVEVLFDRSAYTPPTSNVDGTSTIFEGRLRLQTNDADDPITDIDLAGFWQSRWEGGQEPNVNEIWEIFGFGNRIEGLSLNGGGENSVLSTNDVFAQTDETEVLSPYWRIADGYSEAKITQLTAYHGPGGATIGIHNPGNKGQDDIFWNHQGTDNQRILPNANTDSGFATQTFTSGDIPGGWIGDGAFGIEVANLSTDPTLNPTGGVTVEGEQQGHTVKIFQALDAEGNAIPNVYLGIMDYTGINYDYNDNTFVIEGVAPLGFGQKLGLEGLDDAAADDRLVFTSIDQPANGAQEVRDTAVVTLTNEGFSTLSISGIEVGDPSAFEIVGTVPTEIPAGGSAQVTVQFTGTHDGGSAGAQIHNSTLTVLSDDVSAPQMTVQLAGIAQEFSENGSEPTVAQIVEAFGYSTDMAQGSLANGGAVETVGDEVLMPYMQALDPSRDVEVIQIAAFLQQNNVARLGVHGLGSSATTELFAQDDQQYQTILPEGLVPGDGSTGGVARATISGDDPFGLFVSVDGRPTYASWTDPEANRIDPDFGQLVGDDEGHLIRFFQALDAEGEVIEGTYIAIQDYPGAGNYDYNDHMFVIKNVAPHALGDADADGDGINDALQADVDGDGTVDFFDPDHTPDPEPGPEGYVYGVNFGGGAIASDPVLGLALVGQDDSRVTVSGSVNPGAGTDNAGNPNGANATPGSAFVTYEDGADWTASLAVANGTYLVTLYTQETYWDAAGQRQFDATINGEPVIVDLDPFAESGGDTPIAVEAVVTVTDGSIDIGLSADIDNAPLNAVTVFTYEEPDTGGGQAPFPGPDAPLLEDSLTVDASNFDQGGQGVSWNDNPGRDNGGQAERGDTDVELVGGPQDIGHVLPGEWVEYTVNVAEAGTYALSLNAKTPIGGNTIAVSVEDGAPIATFALPDSNGAGTGFGGTSFGQTPATNVELAAGLQTLRFTFGGQTASNGYLLDFRSFALDQVETSEPPEDSQTPFLGQPFLVDNAPVTIDASDYDNGGQGVAYNDQSGLQGGNAGGRTGSDVEQTSSGDVGWIAEDEWLEYTVDVAEAGTYALSFTTATPADGRSITVSAAQGGAVYAEGTAAVPNTGAYSSYVTGDTVELDLAAGQQVLRLAFSGGSFDLRSFDLAPVPGDGQAPYGGTARSVDATDGLVLDAALFDEGGQDVAYNDSSAGQEGNDTFRPDTGVDIVGEGDAVGWIADGEWVEYTIEVEEAGLYDISFLSAMASSGTEQRSVEASFAKDGEVYTSSGEVEVGRTANWWTFDSTAPAQVELEAGTQVMRVAFSGGSQDLASVTLTPAAPEPFAALFDFGGQPAAAILSAAGSMMSPFLAEGSDGPGDDLPPEPEDADAPDPADGLSSQTQSLFGHDLAT
ncbi:Carbohydrate binding module (family 6) [Tranquillimonas rosea]|uniref:Carbohydrate binding module (Family 6) n=1 Tax=Tranquillimonas rosea TaxID=641238 RepID=A0A1H9WZI8_9RHOB|nr:carbohydrate-binding protein [Tranquillimonas rosea]SES39254.1 Carbohydrate binding module (family 6) [Tranquillimonas rosea]